MMLSEGSRELLNKAGAFFRRRDTTSVRSAHPLISMPGDKTVNHISERPGNEDEGIQPGPKPRKTSKNFEGCGGFCEDFSVFQK